MKAQKLFVYGTLKKNFYFHDKFLGLGRAEFIDDATTGPEFTMYVDGLPHMIKEPSERGVKGEVYEVSPETIAEIDRLEGHPSVYFREIIEVVLSSGERVLAWAYLRHPSFKGREFAWPEHEFL
jgi:gamma-glutamylaminecyclotransferase